jgi:hypothetical protein
MLSEASDKMLHHNIGRLWSSGVTGASLSATWHGMELWRRGWDGSMKNTFANRAGSEEDFREGEDREFFHHRVR